MNMFKDKLRWPPRVGVIENFIVDGSLFQRHVHIFFLNQRKVDFLGTKFIRLSRVAILF